MRINYFYDAARIHEPGGDAEYRRMLRRAGVNTLWLAGAYSGRLQAGALQLKQAADTLREEGFDVGAVTIPVGHPGNSLNPEDDSLELSIPSAWRYRQGPDGQPVYHCADIEPVMMEENQRLMEALASAGVSALFHDDDLRMGDWGPQMGGCFCESCISAFNAATGRRETRESLLRGLAGGRDAALCLDWSRDLCRKLGHLVDAMAVQGPRSGIMVMHAGDERHGINLPALSAAHPDMLYRVGEAHFSNEDYAAPQHRASVWCSILQHLALMQGHETFSETTVFPPRALRPDYLLGKARLALAAGVDHIFYMSGTWRMTSDYWDALARGLDGLRDLSTTMEGVSRIYPVHVANGTAGGLCERLQPPLLPFLSGLPCRPVRGGDGDGPADVLLFFGAYRSTDEWAAKFPGYQAVVLDEAAWDYNRDYTALHGGSLIRAPFTAGDTPCHGEALRRLVREAAPNPIPMAAGAAAVPVWLEGGQVMVFSLENEPVEVELTYGGQTPCRLRLQPAGFEARQA